MLKVLSNERLCSQHLRLTLGAATFATAQPGQFLHLGPHGASASTTDGREEAGRRASAVGAAPFLRRAFSIGGLHRTPDGYRIELVYRVVGAGTSWMAGLRRGDRVDALGPLGNSFATPVADGTAWLVAGGVGLPPVLWFARVLAENGRSAALFVGARSRSLIPLSLGLRQGLTRAEELPHTDLVLATDDGSVGFSGNVVEALADHATRTAAELERVTVYTCGPEAMMGAVADYCAARSITCYVCMERAMACGIGTCQSCVVPVRDSSDPEGWRYALCCRQGPVFDASQVIWGQ